MFGIAGTAELSTFCPGTGTWNRLQDGKRSAAHQEAKLRMDLRGQLTCSLLMDQVPVFLPMEPRLAPYGRPL